MQTNYNPVLQKAYDFLINTQNADGGWGYRRGGMSFVEPTTFALLSLFGPYAAGGQNVADVRFQAVRRALTWIRSQQHPDGGWGVMKEDQASGWMTYPVIWMMNVMSLVAELTSYYGAPEDRDMIDRGRNYILNKGREVALNATVKAQVKKLFQIDSDYRGWSWGSGEAGWVIPTALALIALVIEEPATAREYKEVINAKDYLRDRACPEGGWNVGNPYMLGKRLPPTPDATAFAMVAWRICLTASDFGQNTRVVNAGLNYLEENLALTNSDHTAALSIWALSLFKEPGERETLLKTLINGSSEERIFIYRGQELKKKTVTGQNKDTGAWANSPYTTAIATLALSDNRYFLEPK